MMKGEIYVENMDKHWKEVVDLAEEYGFIIQAYGGVAVLATHEVQKEKFGEGKYKNTKENLSRGEVNG